MLNDAEAAELNQSVAKAIGWEMGVKEFTGGSRDIVWKQIVWKQPDGSWWSELPDFCRDPHALGRMVEWLDTPKFNLSIHRYQQYESGLFEGEMQPGAWMVALSDNDGGEGNPYFHGDMLNEAVARAIVAYSEAKANAEEKTP